MTSANVDPCHSPVSVIVPNFNGSALLLRNVPSILAALEAYPGPGQLIVVDDGSRDDSREVLARAFPLVTLIRHETNRGFAEAIRSGVGAASSEFLIFLNSDVQPAADFVAPLVRSLADPSVFAVSPMILEETGEVHPCSLNCFGAKKGRLKRLRGAWAEPAPHGPARPTVFASGGSMALKKSVFLELGGFLPIFQPFYWEDLDLGIRAWRRGWRVMMEPSSLVVHQHHGSIRENIPRRQVRVAVQRNKFLVEWIHVPVPQLLIGFLPRLLLRMIARTAIRDPIFWPALFGALARVPQVIAARREIRSRPGAGKTLPEILACVERENRHVFRGDPA